MTKELTYEFTLTLTGRGETEEEAWIDAVDAFSADPGTPPNPPIIIDEEE